MKIIEGLEWARRELKGRIEQLQGVHEGRRNAKQSIGDDESQLFSHWEPKRRSTPPDFTIPAEARCRGMTPSKTLLAAAGRSEIALKPICNGTGD